MAPPPWCSATAFPSGVKLDRNGLRPMRYLVTHDGLVIAGSENGPWWTSRNPRVRRTTHRLGPGEMILATPQSGVFLRWRELLKSVTTQVPA